MIVSFALMRKDSPRAHILSFSVLRNFLEFNNNSENKFSDCYYKSTLISALSACLISMHPTEDLESPHNKLDAEYMESRNWFIEEINKLCTIDAVAPSFHNVITTTCLKVMMDWMFHGIIQTDLNIFLTYSR